RGGDGIGRGTVTGVQACALPISSRLMLSSPGFNEVAFELGPSKVHWYGIVDLLGFAAAWWLARRRAAQPGSTWKKNDVDDVIFFAMLGVILGGRIGYVLFYGLTFWANDAG